MLAYHRDEVTQLLYDETESWREEQLVKRSEKEIEDQKMAGVDIEPLEPLLKHVEPLKPAFEPAMKSVFRSEKGEKTRALSPTKKLEVREMRAGGGVMSPLGSPTLRSPTGGPPVGRFTIPNSGKGSPRSPARR